MGYLLGLLDPASVLHALIVPVIALVAVALLGVLGARRVRERRAARDDARLSAGASLFLLSPTPDEYSAERAAGLPSAFSSHRGAVATFHHMRRDGTPLLLLAIAGTRRPEDLARRIADCVGAGLDAADGIEPPRPAAILEVRRVASACEFPARVRHEQLSLLVQQALRGVGEGASVSFSVTSGIEFARPLAEWARLREEWEGNSSGDSRWRCDAPLLVSMRVGAATPAEAQSLASFGDVLGASFAHLETHPARSGALTCFAPVAPWRVIVKQAPNVEPRHPLRRHRATFACNASQAGALASPVPWGADSGAVGSRFRRQPPPVVIGEEGTVIAVSDLGPVTIPVSARVDGIFTTGAPGYGKTSLVKQVFASDLALRRRTVERERVARHALFWWEAKGEVAPLLEIVDRCAVDPDEVVVLNVAAGDGFRLDLFGGDPTRAASLFTEAFGYSLKPGEIMGYSRDVLQTVFELALRLPPETTERCGYGREPNVVQIAFDLLGGTVGERRALLLRNEVESIGGVSANGKWQDDAAGVHTEVLGPLERIVARYLRLIDDAQKSRSVAAFTAPLNKLRLLLAHCPEMFETGSDRPVVTFEALLEARSVVVVNLGAYGDRRPTDETSDLLASLLFYLFADAVQNVCRQWQSEGNFVACYVDELARVTAGGSTAATVSGLRQIARSLGWWPVFGTQFFYQLDATLAADVRGFASKAYFRLELPEAAERAAGDLAPGGGGVGPQHIQALPRYEAICRVESAGGPTPPFAAHVVPDDEIVVPQSA